MNTKQLIISIGTIAVKLAVAYLIITYMIQWMGAAHEFGYRMFAEEPMTGEPGITYNVTVTEESTPKQIAEALEEYGLIRDKNLFYAQYMVSEYRNKIEPGTYDLNTSMTAEQMLEIMSPEEDEAEEE